MPFEDSRRLTGSNLFFPATGAVLEAVGIDMDDGLLGDWRANVARARRQLGWDAGAPCVSRRHLHGTTLAVAAPADQLFTATELNEWALCAALHARDPLHWGGLREALRSAAAEAGAGPASAVPPEIDPAAALSRLTRIAAAEARPELSALLSAARSRGLPVLLDDDTLTLGCGAGGHSYPLEALPAVEAVPWAAARAVPAALVTGSNGKTTTVRLVAACAAAHGWRPGYCCTDGVFVAGEAVAAGDYSGPAGARRVLRDARVEAAVLETARGGILRRGLALERAGVAVVTNVSADHFGEYGIHDLEALADVKLTVGAAVAPGGTLVLNADDAVLRERAPGLASRYGAAPAFAWFGADADDPFLHVQRTAGAATCGVRAGRLLLGVGGAEHDLGAIADMPLTVAGRATYNVANLAAAALAATGLGIAPGEIAAVFAAFGTRMEDNPGRMMRFERDGVRLLVDYAHNPEGLRALLQVAQGLRPEGGRLGLLLGHAGNRTDQDIERLATTAAAFRPDLVVIKELGAYLRGRAPGDVPGLLRAALLRAGLPESSVVHCASEVEATRQALEWARPGDLLVLPVHELAARSAVLGMLGRSVA